MGYDFFDDNDYDGCDSTEFLETPLPSALPRSKEHLLDRLPMKWNAELFESLATHGCKSRHVGLMADGLDLLTPPFIRVIEQAVLKSFQIAGC